MKYILASKSPRRSEILQNLGIPFRVVTADTDESSPLTDPCALVEELSRRKGESVRQKLLSEGEDLSGTVIISSDTVVATAEGEILGKPRDEAEACRMLGLLEGKTHRVVSGISLLGTLADGKTVVGTSHEVTLVTFDSMDADTVLRYVRATNPYDKAGAYAIQGMASAWISGIQGCYFNVVGLPVHRMCTLYREIFRENLL